MGDPRVLGVPVVESGEDMVDVRAVTGLLLDSLKQTPDGAYAYLRRGLVQRLLFAEQCLPSGYRLQLVEGYRRRALQEQYFAEYRRQLEDLHPDLDGEETYQLASRYVSPPDVAPHVSGAAVDLTLVDGLGIAVDLGTPVNATPEASSGACYFAAENVTSRARHHRRILGAALEAAGLVNYPTEWWHWSYGDQYWAMVQGRPAATYGAHRAVP